MGTPIDAITAFLGVLFGDQSSGTLFLSGGPRRSDGKVAPWRDTSYDLARCPLGHIARAAVLRGQCEEVYYSAALFAGTRRVETQAVTFPYLYSDLDTGVIPPSVPDPTLLLLTSPGRRQAVWKLSTPTDRYTATMLNRRIAHVCHADPSGADATQVLRLPSTPNWKYPDVVTKIEGASGHVYTVDAFSHLPDGCYRPPPDIVMPHLETDPARGAVVWTWAYPRLTARMMRVANGDNTDYGHDASRGDAALILALRRLGLTDAEVAAAFSASPCGEALRMRKGADRFPYLVGRALRNSRVRLGEVIEL